MSKQKVKLNLCFMYITKKGKGSKSFVTGKCASELFSIDCVTKLMHGFKRLSYNAIVRFVYQATAFTPFLHTVNLTLMIFIFIYA